MGYGLAMKYYLIVWGAFEECMRPMLFSIWLKNLANIQTSRPLAREQHKLHYYSFKIFPQF